MPDETVSSLQSEDLEPYYDSVPLPKVETDIDKGDSYHDTIALSPSHEEVRRRHKVHERAHFASPSSSITTDSAVGSGSPPMNNYGGAFILTYLK